MNQQPDNQPGNYYVSVMDGPRVGRLLGPFENDHQAALNMVDRVRKEAERQNHRAAFYAFGTLRIPPDQPAKPGLLNAEFGMPA